MVVDFFRQNNTNVQTPFPFLSELYFFSHAFPLTDKIHHGS